MFTWVDLVGSVRLGIKLVILEARESHTHTDTHTDREFLRCTEILSDLITLDESNKRLHRKKNGVRR